MYTKIIALCLASSFILAGCSKSSDNDLPADEEQVITDISYGSHAQQKMDVHLPAERNTQTPVVIFLHGGGFVAGDKAEVNAYMRLFLDRGYAVVNANYRLVDSTGLSQTPVLHQESAIKISDQLNDIRSITDKVAASVASWKVSDSEWLLAGHSAGATLALLYAHGNKNSDKRIKVVANIAGATSFAFSDESEAALVPPLLLEVLFRATGVPATNPNKLAYMAISPYWVSNNSSNAVAAINIRPEQDSGDDLYRAYTQLLISRSVVNQYLIITGAGHSLDPDSKKAEAVVAIDAFARAAL